MLKPGKLNFLAEPVLTLPRSVKRAVAVLVDTCLCVLTVWLAFFLRLDEWVPLIGHEFWRAETAALISIALALPIFIKNGLYRVIFRYSEMMAVRSIVVAMSLYALFYFSIISIVGFTGIPRTVGIIQPILLFLAICASRLFASFWLGGAYKNIIKKVSRPKVLIYGAGNAGRQLAMAMHNSPDMQVVGFLDDDPKLHKQVLNGLTIYNPRQLPSLVQRLSVQKVLLAIPSVDRHRRNEILSMIREAKVAVHTLPSVSDLAQGKVSIADITDLDIDDLLGRDTVEPDPVLLAQNITGKTVLVTGAGGSIGSEICRQVIRLKPHRLLLVDSSEYALYAIHSELEHAWQTALAKPQQQDGMTEEAQPSPIIPLLGSVQDEERMRELMETWRPPTIYHAAAYKHVPLVEHNPAEGIKNNVFGTLTLAKLAVEFKVSDFVLISTDKAVRPTNIMGASKRLAEMVLQALSNHHGSASGTKFTMVRFGNVLGSSGSVVPKFRQQIRDGGPVTVTHPEVTRYFMTIPEAAQLVIQAGAMSKGGDVFVLDMGSPVKIIDLARRLIELSGYSVRDENHPEGDIEIAITGLRPGEKLYEELLIGNNPQPTSHTRIMRAQEDFIAWPSLQEKLAEMNAAVKSNDVDAIRRILQTLVSGYIPSASIVDWIHLESASEQEVQ